MKLVIIIVLLLAVLGGGGGAGWWFFLREQPMEEAGAKPELKGVAGGKLIFELDPFEIPILREGQVTQHLAFIMRLEMTVAEDEDEFEKSIPRLRDTLFTELHGMFAFRHIQAGGEALPIVRDRLIAAGNKVLGEGRIKSIFLRANNRRLIADR